MHASTTLEGFVALHPADAEHVVAALGALQKGSRADHEAPERDPESNQDASCDKLDVAESTPEPSSALSAHAAAEASLPLDPGGSESRPPTATSDEELMYSVAEPPSS
jgi:hypothetical protein